MWLLTVGCLVGSILNSYKRRACFWIWIVCNIAWIIIDIKNMTYSRATLDAVQTVFCIIGLHEWSKHGD